VRRGLARLSELTEWAVAAMMAVLVAVTLLQVYFRYFTSGSLDWSEELARYLFVWIAFLTGAVAVRRRAHIVVDLLVARLPSPVQRGLAFGTVVVTLAFLAFLTVYGVSLVRIVWTQTSPGLGISRGYVFLSVPVGASLMFVNLLEVLWGLTRNSSVLSAFSPADSEA
jgi:TRAP-type C4-dicarboxylate transport system permease small subunit